MDDKSLNKYISETGICSRREADKLIELKKVTINGIIATKGNRVVATDIVKIDGNIVKTNRQIVYIAMNKPRGITCTTDLKDKHNIIDFIKYKERIFPIGRLDKDSDGLIFLTNDGDIVNKILRAGNNHEKEYIVTVDKQIDDAFILKMSKGVKILDTVTLPCKVTLVGKNKFRIILTQGLNRQIRRMATALGFEVRTLTRTRIMNIDIQNIPLGKWRYFTEKEIKTILHLVENSVKTQEASDFDLLDNGQ
jgi:23S rRNA pseudouridine2604 synthase